MTDTTPETTPTDWRGTPITPGALVIYGAPVGRSIAMVEAVVADPMLTPSGRIWLDILRRAYGSYSYITGDGASKVHVGADRLTVVSVLPPTTRLTEEELAERFLEQRLRRERWENRYHTANGHTVTITATGYLSCDNDCFREGQRFDKAWQAGRPLDETP
jgi:hypothetical protein